MVSTLFKTLVVVIFVSGLLYCANLAFQGNLEMEIVLRDAHTAIAYIKSFLK